MSGNVARRNAEASVVTGGEALDPGGAPSAGTFYAPTLLRCESQGSAEALANAGKGSLVMSIFSHDPAFISGLVSGSSIFHGRMMIIDRDSAADATGHGAALPASPATLDLLAGI